MSLWAQAQVQLILEHSFWAQVPKFQIFEPHEPKNCVLDTFRILSNDCPQLDKAKWQQVHQAKARLHAMAWT